jgi:hypothetical protein
MFSKGALLVWKKSIDGNVTVSRCHVDVGAFPGGESVLVSF